MLQSLDILIAFVVIMTIVSLFVTISVQMVSAALSLRGKNLANALALTFQSIDPSLAASAHGLATKILSDPLLSDSTRTIKNLGGGGAPARTGPWHFREILRGASQLANAIRPEEVYDGLKNLAKDFEASQPDIVAAKTALATARANVATASGEPAISAALSLLVTADAALAAARAAALVAAKIPAAGLPGTAYQLLAGLGIPVDTANVVARHLTAINSIAGILLPEDLAKFNAALTGTGASLVKAIDDGREQFNRCFSSAQDRAQQWFQLHTRGITIVASFVIAFGFQLDAVDVFHYVSTNAAARAALVASADKVVTQGNGILEDKVALIERVNEAWDRKPDRLTAEELKGVTHTAQLQDSLSRKATGDIKWDQVAFDATVRKTADAYYKEKQGQISDLTKVMNANGFELIPTGFWRWPTVLATKHGKATCRDYFITYWSHGVGMLLFAGLLSLGAPYWYNILKNLSSLRPAVAQLIGAEDTAKTETKK